MNVARFQLILNHDDLDVVSAGLKEFALTVLKEHEAEDSFGYCGRSRYNSASNVLTPVLPSSTIGLLHSYLSSSPQVEELFIVWSLVDRSSNNELCSALNRCLAVILHCAQSLENICNDIVNRILHEFWKNITAMLDSNNTELVHSCLSLLITMCRTSKNNCDQVLQKLNFNDNVFTSMIQKGKTKQTGLMTPSGQSVIVDSRILLIVLIFTLLLNTNEAGLERILASNSIVKKIMHGLTKDVSVSLELILNAVLFLVDRSSVIRSHLLDIVDAGCIDKLLSLFQSEDVAMQAIVERFFGQFVSLCTQMLQGNDANSFTLRTSLSNVIKLLKPQKDKRHRQLQISILSAVPYQLSQSLNSDGFQWDAATIGSEYNSMLAHLTNVLTVTPFDGKQKETLRQKFTSWDAANKKNRTQLSSVLVQEVMAALLPSGLGKSELSKLLTHANQVVVAAGLRLLRAVLVRLQRLLSDAGISRAVFQRVTPSVLWFKWLPEQSTLLDLTLKSVKRDSTSSSVELTDDAAKSAGAEASVEADALNDDFDFNFLGGARGGATTATPRKAAVAASDSEAMDVENDNNESDVDEKVETVLELSLEVVAHYVSLFAVGSSSTASSADVLKLLNETVSFEADVTPDVALTELEAKLSPQVLSGVLLVLRRVATEAGWFGHRNEAAKLLAGLALQKGLQSVQQQSLSKLLLLCASKQDSLSADSVTLLKQVLLNSGLFEGHGVSDFALHCEAQCWLQLASLKPANATLLSAVFSSAYHYSADLCCTFAAASISQSQASVSSLSLALLVLAVGDFSVFASDFPKQLQAQLAVTNARVVCEQRAAFQCLLLDWLNVVLKYSPEPLNYFASFNEALKAVLSAASEADDSVTMVVRAVSSYCDLLTLASAAATTSVSFNKQRDVLTRIVGRSTSSHLKEAKHITAIHVAYVTREISTLIDIKPNVNIMADTLHQHWQLVCSLSCSAVDIPSMSVVEFMVRKWKADLTSASVTTISRQLLVHNAVLLSQRLLNVVSAKFGTTASSVETNNKKKRKKPADEEPAEDPVAALKDFCFDLLVEGLTSVLTDVATTSQQVASVLSYATTSVLTNHCLDASLFGEWCRKVMTVIADAVAASGAKQSNSVQQMWFAVTAGLSKHCSGAPSVWSNDKSLAELCTALYKCTASIELKLVLSKLDAESLRVIDGAAVATELHQSAPKVDDLLRKNGSFSETVALFAELCKQPALISSDGSVKPLIADSESGSVDFVPLLIPSAAAILKQFTDTGDDDVSAALNFLRCGYPSVLGASSGCLLSTKDLTTGAAKEFPLLATALLLLVDRDDSSRLSVKQLNNFMEQVVLPSCKGKLLAALHSLTALLIASVKSHHHYQKNVLMDFLRRYVSEYRHFNDRWLLDDLLLLPLLQLKDVIIGDVAELSELWQEAFSSVLKLFLSVNSNMMIKQHPNVDRVKLTMQIDRVHKLLSLSQCTVQSPAAVSVFTELNKWVKCCLKYELNNVLVLRVMQELSNRLASTTSNSLLSALITSNDADSDGNALCAPVLLNMIAGHSQLSEVLLGHDLGLKVSLVRLVVSLTLHSIAQERLSDVKESLLFLCEPLWSLFKGSTSSLDQAVRRFFHLLERCEGLGLGVCLQHMRVGSPFTESSDKAGLTETWLFDLLTPPMVYATLSNVDPARCSVVSTPYPWETTDILNGSKSSDDLLLSVGSSSHTYDIGYFLPVIFNTLRNFDVSIRRLTNCGAASLVMIGLSSSCPSTRSFALASLHLIYLLLHKQTPEVDPSFRERSQLLQMMSWLKNSIVSVKDRKSDAAVPSVAPMIGIFLGRAVLNIMQSNHELYAVINKYLLSRPWCDLSDVPLLEFLLNQSDSQTNVSERLAVLRLLRDGLITSQDHSNLCRKNGFNRLMLLFCIHSTDVRIGYAILDVIERGLLIKQSAKYLMERCDLLSWLHSTIVSSSSKFRQKALTLLRTAVGCSYIASVKGSFDELQTVHKLLLNVAQTLAANAEDASAELIRMLLLCLWDVSLVCQEQSWFEGWSVSVLLRLYEAAIAKKLPADVVVSIAPLAAFARINYSPEETRMLSGLLVETLNPSNLSTSRRDESSGYDSLKKCHEAGDGDLWKAHVSFAYKASQLLGLGDQLLLSCGATILARCCEFDEGRGKSVAVLRWAVVVWRQSCALTSHNSNQQLLQQLNRICLRVMTGDNSTLSWIENPSDRFKVTSLCEKALNLTNEGEATSASVLLVMQLALLVVASISATAKWSDFQSAASTVGVVNSWLQRMESL